MSSEKRKRDIMVSIVCITYNHAAYIEDALKGFLKQKTDFDFEIIVRDDASTDGTTEIIRRYAEQYPERITALIEEKNQYSKMKTDGSKGNSPMFEILQKHIKYGYAKGKYVACCEGDDMWIDAHKLQIQVSYMEEHSECMMTGHDALIVDYKTGEITTRNAYDDERDLSCEEALLMPRGLIPTASRVYRKDIWDMDDFFWHVGVGDLPQQYYCAANGKIHYFDRVMSVYRHFVPGSWSQRAADDTFFDDIHRIRVVHFFSEYNQYTMGIYAKYMEMKTWEYLWAIRKTHLDLSWQEFERLCETYDEKTKHRYSNYFQMLKQVSRIMTDMCYLDDEIREYRVRYPHLVIMGAGDYGCRLAEKFQQCSLAFDGFVVSDDQTLEAEVLGKPVWKLGGVPFDKEELAVIAAASPIIGKEMCSVLEDREMHYYYPFTVKMG